MEEIKRIIGVELPGGSFELISEKDKDRVREACLRSRKELDELIEGLQECCQIS
jgi:hypothetical protein